MPSPLPIVDVAVAVDAGAATECCPAPTSVTDGIVADEVATALARMFKALGDPTRVKLISLIAAAPNREACICDLTDPVGLRQPTVSHHMKQLVEAGLASRDQRGKWAYYRVEEAALTTLARALNPASTG